MPRITAATHEILIDRATMFELGKKYRVINYATSLLPKGMTALKPSNARIVAVDHDTYRIVFRVAVYVEDAPEVTGAIHSNDTVATFVGTGI